MGREEELLGTSMRKKLVFWLKGLVLFGFCVVSIFLLGAGSTIRLTLTQRKEPSIQVLSLKLMPTLIRSMVGIRRRNIITKMVNRSVPKKYTMLKIRIGIG